MAEARPDSSRGGPGVPRSRPSPIRPTTPAGKGQGRGVGNSPQTMGRRFGRLRQTAELGRQPMAGTHQVLVVYGGSALARAVTRTITLEAFKK